MGRRGSDLLTMFPYLPKDELFSLGEPLRASSWNRLIDASVYARDAWSREHADGERHASIRIEQAAALLKWDGGIWEVVVADRIRLVNVQTNATQAVLSLEFVDLTFRSQLDYAVIAQCSTGEPGVVLQPTKTNTSFEVSVPAEGEMLSIVVYGRQEIASAGGTMPATGWNDLEIRTGDILSIEALHEAVDYYQSLRVRMQEEHVADADGYLIHPAPRWPSAVAYLAPEIDIGIRSLSRLHWRWGTGWKSRPTIDPDPRDVVIGWELDATGPQCVLVGVEWGDASWPGDWERLRMSADGVDGKGRLIMPGDTVDREGRPVPVAEQIAGLLLVVRAW